MTAIDTFKYISEGETAPVSNGVTVTPSDSEELPKVSRALYIGAEGDIKVKTLGGDTLTFVGVAAGQILPIRVIQIFATGTTASNIISLW